MTYWLVTAWTRIWLLNPLLFWWTAKCQAGPAAGGLGTKSQMGLCIKGFHIANMHFSLARRKVEMVRYYGSCPVQWRSAQSTSERSSGQLHTWLPSQGGLEWRWGREWESIRTFNQLTPGYQSDSVSVLARVLSILLEMVWYPVPRDRHWQGSLLPWYK